MADPLLKAARATDSIQHSEAFTGLVVGLLAGVALGIATVATGGAALVVVATVAGLACTGATIGEAAFGLSIVPGVVTGAIATGSPDVMVAGNPAARCFMSSVGGACPVNDQAACAGEPPFWFPVHGDVRLAQGAMTVFVNGHPVVRDGDMTECSAVILAGQTTVLIGGPGVQTLDIQAEVPGPIHTILTVVGLAAGLILTGPIVVALGFVGSLVGGPIGAGIAHDLWPDSKDALRIGGLVGSLVGGFLGGKAGKSVAPGIAKTMFPDDFAAQAMMSRGYQTPEALDALNRASDMMTRMQSGDLADQFKPPDARPGGLWRDGTALQWLKDNGYSSLEDTVAGKAANEFWGEYGKFLPPDVANQFWDAASTQYAGELVASGQPVTVVDGRGGVNADGTLQPGAVDGSYGRAELPVLQASGADVNVTVLDPVVKPPTVDPGPVYQPPVIVPGDKDRQNP